MPLADRPRLRHDGIFYDDEGDFVETVVPFVRDGIEAGEVVLLNTGSHPVSPLLRAMFCDEEQVVVGRETGAATPASMLDTYRRTMEQGIARGATGYRAVGWLDLDANRLPWQEWLRYEAAANKALADLPLRTLCPFDLRTMSEGTAEAMMATHTGLVGPDGWRSNDGYVDPGTLVVRDDLRTPPHPLESGAPRMVLQSTNDLMELRMELYSATVFPDLPRVRLDDFVKAVGEVVGNAHKHGGDPVLLRLWASDTTAICTVTDSGPGIADPLAGFARPRHPSQGLGLWAARQLCDIVDYQHGPDGFTVRVASFL